MVIGGKDAIVYYPLDKWDCLWIPWKEWLVKSQCNGSQIENLREREEWQWEIQWI